MLDQRGLLLRGSTGIRVSDNTQWRQGLRTASAVALLLFVVLAPRVAAGDSRPGIRQVGFLTTFSSANDRRFEAFKQKLQELGHVDGQTIVIHYRSAEGQYDRLPTLASDLVQRNVDIIMADGGTPTIAAVRDATRTIPTVFCCPSDPVAQGIVASLAKPGGNLTGVSTQNLEYGPKSLELLKEILPSAKRVAVLSNPTNSSIPLVLGHMKTSAQTLGLEIHLIDAKTPADFERAFAEITRHRPAGLVILSDSLLSNNAPRLTALAARHRLPTMGGTDAIPESGGLASYGPNRLDLLRRSAVLLGKILKGAKPADLPVEQPTQFDLVINMRTAKALSLTIPASVLLRVNSVIE